MVVIEIKSGLIFRLFFINFKFVVLTIDIG
jgi:hypothetical protein